MNGNIQQDISRNLEAKRELEQLLDSPAWRRVVGILQEQTDAYQREVLFTPCTGVDSAMLQEYKKGQIEGRLSISAAIQTEIETCEINLEHLRRTEDAQRIDSSDGDTESASTSGVQRAP